jgi:hypothetical protein
MGYSYVKNGYKQLLKGEGEVLALSLQPQLKHPGE